MGPGEGAGSRSRLGLGDEWTGPSLPLPGPGAAECLACVGSGRGGGGVVVALRVGANLAGPGLTAGLGAHRGVKPTGSRGKQRGGGTAVATRGQGVCLNGESELNSTSAFCSQWDLQ